MWFSLAKLEFKKGIIYYLLIYFFFFFWSIFTLIILFLYANFTNLSKIISEKNELIIAFYQSKNKLKATDIEKFFKKFSYVESISLVPPKEVYAQIKNDISIVNLSEEEINQYFPYLIKIKLSYDKVNDIKKEINSLKKLSSESLEILSEPSPSIFSLSAWKNLNLILFLLLIFSQCFYFLFFYFLYQNLNEFLKEQTQIFQLLGGHIFKLIFIRLSLLLIPLFFLAIFSFLLYLFLASKFIYFFPIFKLFPNLQNLKSFFIFLLYSVFIVVLYPLLITFRSYKKV